MSLLDQNRGGNQVSLKTAKNMNYHPELSKYALV